MTALGACSDSEIRSPDCNHGALVSALRMHTLMLVQEVLLIGKFMTCLAYLLPTEWEKMIRVLSQVTEYKQHV